MAQRGNLYIIPSGFFVFHYSSTDVSTVRWSLGGELETQKASLKASEELLNLYPSLATTAYSPWAAFLKKNLPK